MFSVLIDTSSYEELKLSFQGKIFNSLLKLGDDGKILLIGSNVIRREMEAHLLDEIKSSVNIVEKASKKVGRLIQDDFGEFSILLNDTTSWKENLYSMRKARMDNFFLKMNYEELDSANVNINQVVDDYFNGNPPFGDGRKKEEFPDAIVLNSFIQSNQQNLKRTCLVSKDGDWVKFAETKKDLRIFSSIAEFIDFIHTKFDSEFLDSLKDKIQEEKNELSKQVEWKINNQAFEVDDSWIDPEVELDSRSLKIEVLGFNVISFNQESAEVEAELNVTFQVNLWVDDESACYKDDDTKEWVYFGRNYYSVDVEKQVTANLTVTYETHPQTFLDMFEIEDISLPNDFSYIDSEEFDFVLVKHWNE